MQWYYSKNGTQLGPVPQSELLSKLASGEVAAGDLVWREGLSDWVPAGQVAELKVLGTNVPAAPAAPTAPAAGERSSPYAPPVSGMAPAVGPEIRNYLWQSVVVTLFCCLPFGIVAIVYAAKVDPLKAQGDIAGAMAASASAKTWAWISFGIGLGVMALYLIGIIASAASSSQF